MQRTIVEVSSFLFLSGYFLASFPGSTQLFNVAREKRESLGDDTLDRPATSLRMYPGVFREWVVRRENRLPFEIAYLKKTRLLLREAAANTA